MELPLFVFVLVSFCGAQEWKQFCHDKPCPKYTVERVLETKTELRSYDPTEWITTKMEGTDIGAFMAAHKRLKSVEGYVDSWPVLINVKNGNEYWLYWFVDPGTNLQISDPLVILQSKPKADVYVRTVRGSLSIKTAKEKKEAFCKDLLCKYLLCNDWLRNDLLCKDLLCKGLPKPCSALQTYAGAGYDSYWSLYPHNEIWIYKTQ